MPVRARWKAAKEATHAALPTTGKGFDEQVRAARQREEDANKRQKERNALLVEVRGNFSTKDFHKTFAEHATVAATKEYEKAEAIRLEKANRLVKAKDAHEAAEVALAEAIERAENRRAETRAGVYRAGVAATVLRAEAEALRVRGADEAVRKEVEAVEQEQMDEALQERRAQVETLIPQ